MTAFALDIERHCVPKTVRNHRQALALFADCLVQSDRGDTTVADLSRQMLVDFYGWLRLGRHGVVRSLDTKRRLVEKIEGFWSWLDRNEWHKAVPRARSIEMAHEQKRPVIAPTFEEMSACVMACVSEGPRRLATLLYFTGARVDQAVNFTWDDVDMARALLTVGPQKGLPGRIIPISQHLVAELATWGMRTGQLIKWRVVPQVRERVIAEAWARAKVREGAWKRHQNHAFRKGLVSSLAGIGVSEELAEIYVGHAVKGTRRHYLDIAHLKLREVADVIPALGATNVQQLSLSGVG